MQTINLEIGRHTERHNLVALFRTKAYEKLVQRAEAMGVVCFEGKLRRSM